MRLVRNNVEDPRVARDLEMLADAFGDDEARAKASELRAAAESPGGVDDGETVAEDGPDPLEDPFVRTFVGAAVHLKRYAPFYAGALLWLAVILLVKPVSGGTEDGFATESFAAAPAASGLAADDAALAVPLETSGATFSDFGGSPDVRFDGADSAFDDTGVALNPGSSSSPVFDDSPPVFADTPIDSEPAGPAPLVIVASGYSSQTGGTPLEQEPPEKGLPITAAGNQDAKRSFIKLTGEQTILRMKQVTTENANVNAEAAQIKICPITKADWQPARNQALAAGPPFNADTCQAGAKKPDGVWEWDLSQFGPPGALPGFALTRGAGATANSFQIVLAPVALAVASG